MGLIRAGVGVVGDGPAVQIDFSVVHPADEDKLVEIGASAGGPGGDVVCLAFGCGPVTHDAPAVT